MHAAAAPLALAVAAPHVFLVDDAEDNREVYAFYLRESGFRVTEATQGLEAFEQLKTGPVPDVLVTDIRLPDIDGFELCRRVRAQPRLESVRVIAITALPLTPQHVERAREVGSEILLGKPCLPERLGDEIRRLLLQGQIQREYGRQTQRRVRERSDRSRLPSWQQTSSTELQSRSQPTMEGQNLRDLLKRRIVAEYTEMPGLSLNAAQACRLWGIEPRFCRALLDDLVTEGVLVCVRTDTYLSASRR